MDLRGWFPLPLLVALFFVGDPGDCCRAVDARRAIAYRLIKADARSPGAVLVRRRVAGIAKCRDFAERKGALAFNYGDFFCSYSEEHVGNVGEIEGYGFFRLGSIGETRICCISF